MDEGDKLARGLLEFRVVIESSAVVTPLPP